MSDGSDETPTEEGSQADGPANGDEDETPESDETIGESDIIRLAYTVRSIESDQLIDTTDPEVAEDEGVDTDERSFEPRVIALGSGQVFPSVETELIGREVGDSGEVEVAADEAFGEYDPEQVRTVSADAIPDDDRYPGAQVEIDGEHGYVETIIGGRARIDFNHPLAGEPIEYRYEILERIDDRLEQARGLLAAVVDADLDLWIETDEEERPVEFDDDDEDETEAEDDEEPETEIVELETLYVESVPQLALNQQWLFRKHQIAQDIIERVGVDRVIVQETIDAAPPGLAGLGDVEAALEGTDIDAEDIAEDIEGAADDVGAEESIEAKPDE